MTWNVPRGGIPLEGPKFHVGEGNWFHVHVLNVFSTFIAVLCKWLEYLTPLLSDTWNILPLKPLCTHLIVDITVCLKTYLFSKYKTLHKNNFCFLLSQIAVDANLIQTLRKVFVRNVINNWWKKLQKIFLSFSFLIK